VVKCCGVSCRRICICPHRSTLKAHYCDGDLSLQNKDTKFLMDSSCVYVVVPMPVSEEWRTNGAVNLASVIFARKH